MSSNSLYSKRPISEEETIKYRSQVSPFFETLKQREPLEDKDMKTIESVIHEMQSQFSEESLRADATWIMLSYVVELNSCINERIQDEKDEVRYKELCSKSFEMKKKGVTGSEYNSIVTELDKLHKKFSLYH